MNNKKFDERKSRELIICFLKRLQTECDESFSITGLERLPRIIDLLSNDVKGAEIWKITYQMTFGRSLELISENEAFTTLIGFCALQTHTYKFNLVRLIDLLFLIRYQSEQHPEEHEKERVIWSEVVNSFSTEVLS